MKPIKKYCVKFVKFRTFVNPKISYVFEKTLVLSIICGKCDNSNDKIWGKKSIKILKVIA